MKKQRAFEEQERDMFFRQLEVARDQLVQSKAKFLSTHKDIEKIKENQHLEQKVFLRFRTGCSIYIHITNTVL